MNEAELIDRVFLARVMEPGDEAGGRWIREWGTAAVASRLRGGGEALPGVSEKRWAGLLARAAVADAERDLGQAYEAGARFVVPGDAEWPGQLDDLGDARPIGLWVRGRAGLRMWALRSVAVVGARACTEYGAHMAATLGTGLAERGWVVVSGGAAVLCPVTVVAEVRCHSCGGAKRTVLADASVHAEPHGGCRGRVAR